MSTADHTWVRRRAQPSWSSRAARSTGLALILWARRAERDEFARELLLEGVAVQRQLVQSTNHVHPNA